MRVTVRLKDEDAKKLLKVTMKKNIKASEVIRQGIALMFEKYK